MAMETELSKRLVLALDEWLFLLGFLWLQWMRITTTYSAEARSEWATLCWVWGVVGGVMVYGIGYGVPLLQAVLRRRARKDVQRWRPIR